MTVRAKFVVTSITQTVHCASARSIELTPQYDSSIPEDCRFAAATPSGKITMFVTNPAAVEQLALGRAFYVDFTPLDEAAI